MNPPRQLQDHDRNNLLDAPNWTIHHGRVQLNATQATDGDNRRFVLSGPTGTHTLLVSATDAARLNAHWQGFCKTDAARCP